MSHQILQSVQYSLSQAQLNPRSPVGLPEILVSNSLPFSFVSFFLRKSNKNMNIFCHDYEAQLYVTTHLRFDLFAKSLLV